MRTLKFLMAVGLVLAVSGTAGALTFTAPYIGPIVMHVHNYADGMTYTGKYNYDGNYALTYDMGSGKWLNPATGAYDLNFAPYYDASKCEVLHAVQNAKTGESGWGIFQVDSIQRGVYDPIGNSVNVDQTNPQNLWATNMFGTEIVGAYFNRVDIAVQFHVAPDGNSFKYTNQFIEAIGDQYQLWEQPYLTMDANQGTGGRLYSGGVPIDKYETIGYDADGNVLSGATLILAGSSLAGFIGQDPNTEVFADFTPSSNTGKVHVFIEVTGGTEAIFFDTGLFYPQKTGFSTYADLRLDVDDKPTSKADWLVYSSDPLQGAFVPEPLTVLGAFLGIGALGRYVAARRRPGRS